MAGKEERIRKLALSYYSRKDIQQAIFSFCQNRETIPRYFEGFGKRPDTLEYPAELISAVKKGATSFHTSEEIWNNPLEIRQEMTPEQYNSIRLGWDLVLDIDSKYLDYSKIATWLILQALEFSGIKNYGIKFSGNRGFHIIVPWKAFPKKVYDKDTKDMFPDYPRIISLYLTNLIKPKLIEKITSLTNDKSYIKDFEAPKKVMPDIILVSPRHLFRTPYSLHEKTSLSSIVITKEQLENFTPQDAYPLKAEVKNFYPNPQENEAKELLLTALDWFKSQETKQEKQTKKQYSEIIVDKRKITYPPCIARIMQGLKDGKKRALFILISYFRSLNFDIGEVEEILVQWNKKNKPSLSRGYIIAQIEWHKKQKTRLPPNCDKDYYKGIAVCFPDNLCPKIKNPVNYTLKMQFRNNKTKQESKKSADN